MSVFLQGQTGAGAINQEAAAVMCWGGHADLQWAHANRVRVVLLTVFAGAQQQQQSLWQVRGDQLQQGRCDQWCCHQDVPAGAQQGGVSEQP